jgi:hypothetical protein
VADDRWERSQSSVGRRGSRARHARIILGESQVDKPPFREGTEWTTTGKSPAFAEFSLDGISPDQTPFSPLAPLNYKNAYKAGYGPHPVMFDVNPSEKISQTRLQNEFSSPLFPDPLD